MKEYRLKKWYPSLPQNWNHKQNIIVVQREHGYNLHPSLKCINLTEETIRFTEVNQSEFWEEVLPKEFEILRFEYKDKGFIGGAAYTELKENGLYVNSERPDAKGIYTLEHVLRNKNWTIQKVRRLSDGVEFTIGDTVVRHADSSCDTPSVTSRKINNFYFETKLKFGVSPTDQGYVLSVFSHVVKLLLTTEDGVDMFGGESVYLVSLVERAYNMHPTKVRKELVPVPVYFKYFSTKEDAEDFITRNKPVLNAYEISDVLQPYIKSFSQVAAFEALRDRIKEKLGF